MLKNEDKIVEWIDRFAEIPLAEVRNPDDADDTDDNDAISHIFPYPGNYGFVEEKREGKREKRRNRKGKQGTGKEGKRGK